MVDDIRIMIVIPTHSKYKNVINTFLLLLKKYWPDCPYRILISICGDDFTIQGYDRLYNGTNSNLIDCITAVRKKYNYDYYMCFLGDAFMNKKVNQIDVDEIINIINYNNIDYCSLLNVRNYKKSKKLNNCLRYIHSKDRYSHNFISFIVSNQYIDDFLSKMNSDLDFEMKYLSIKENYYFHNHIIVTKNIFNITPGIKKGKWNRFVLSKLKKYNPEIEFAELPIESYCESLYSFFYGILITFIPDYLRKKLKSYGYIKKRSVSKE
ncbi:hypothetical protein [uncultured Thomasclavelia sp.]|uniref:hypothetical protein n=1 Tax=uncultured Thomasclavelia sp. TaxID=3025759 RepID=UPI00261808DA|nr:hypothetical protein [uncultured Thomasclavelia sp.]